MDMTHNQEHSSWFMHSLYFFVRSGLCTGAGVYPITTLWKTKQMRCQRRKTPLNEEQHPQSMSHGLPKSLHHWRSVISDLALELKSETVDGY
jgi:hypothetical protein